MLCWSTLHAATGPHNIINSFKNSYSYTLQLMGYKVHSFKIKFKTYLIMKKVEPDVMFFQGKLPENSKMHCYQVSYFRNFCMNFHQNKFPTFSKSLLINYCFHFRYKHYQNWCAMEHNKCSHWNRLFKCWLTVHKVHCIIITIPRLLSQKHKTSSQMLYTNNLQLFIYLMNSSCNWNNVYIYPTLEPEKKKAAARNMKHFVAIIGAKMMMFHCPRPLSCPLAEVTFYTVSKQGLWCELSPLLIRP